TVRPYPRGGPKLTLGILFAGERAQRSSTSNFSSGRPESRGFDGGRRRLIGIPPPLSTSNHHHQRERGPPPSFGDRERENGGGHAI
ncbi:unnamed protein product, partial [Heterotrigona itama]